MGRSAATVDRDHQAVASAVAEVAARRVPRSIAVVRVTGDLVAIWMAVGLAFLLRFRFGALEVTDAPFDVSAHAVAAGLWTIALAISMLAHRLYDEDTLAAPRGELARLRSSLLESVGVVTSAVFLLRLLSVSRGWFALLVVLSLILLSAERVLLRRALSFARARGRLRRPVVLVTGIADPVETAEFEVVARISAEELPSFLEVAATGGRRWGAALPGVLLQADTRPDDELWDLIVSAGGAGVPVYVASPVRSVATDRLTARALDGRTIVKVAPPALIGIRAFLKRGYDVVLSGVLLILLAIPMALIALGVLLTSGRPVLYGQERVGRGGRTFRMWKFRTMRPDAEEGIGPVWAAANDPRRTSIGRTLRRLSLDELPQLWNVLIGDMSIVGPRPERPPFVEEFGKHVEWYRHRHRIRPGITGLAQVQGLRGDTELAPRVEADNRYIEHWSLWLDLRITLRTLVEMLRGRNAG